MTVVIEAHDLSKRYMLGETMANTLADAVSRLRYRRRADHSYVWALKQVGFQIHEGEVVGLIGRNGAGKSTLLKILARITDPTAGWAYTIGRVGALLEVGTAFHVELTGRENIIINGGLLGMTRADIRRRFDDIVAFAGIGDFLDTPLKRYSSGMYMRLAFSVAAHFEPEIVVVDEVLAVGDAEFQRRCLGKMSELGREGRTVVFVSHDLGAIGRLCDRTMWIDGGSIREDGPTPGVLAHYYAETVPFAATRALAEEPANGGRAARLRAVALTDVSGGGLVSPSRGDSLCVRFEVEVREPVAGLDLGISITNQDGIRILEEALSDQPALVGSLDRPGAYEATMTIPPVLPAGEFILRVWMGSATGTLSEGDLLRFRVQPRIGDPDVVSRRPRAASPAVIWLIEGGEPA